MDKVISKKNIPDRQRVALQLLSSFPEQLSGEAPLLLLASRVFAAVASLVFSRWSCRIETTRRALLTKIVLAASRRWSVLAAMPKIRAAPSRNLRFLSISSCNFGFCRGRMILNKGKNGKQAIFYKVQLILILGHYETVRFKEKMHIFILEKSTKMGIFI